MYKSNRRLGELLLYWVKGRYILGAFGIAVVVLVFVISVLLPRGVDTEVKEQYLRLEGVVYEIETTEYYQRLYIEGEGRRWIVYDDTFKKLALGNTIVVGGMLQPFDAARNPGNFDAREYYRIKGIFASVWADSVEVVDESVFFVREGLRTIRLKAVTFIYQLAEPETAAFLVAIMFGESQGIDEVQEEIYQKVGLGHIFAISGLHISILSLFVYQFIRKCSGSYVMAGIGGGIFLILYVVMTGGATSAIRAAIMFGVRIGGDVTGRVYNLRTAVSLACIFILGGNERLLYDSGFLLSFSAILGIAFVAPSMDNLTSSKFWNKMISNLMTSWGIQLALLPVLLFYFYESSPYSILLNLIVIPSMTILLTLGIAGLILGIIWTPIGELIFFFCDLILNVIDQISQWALSLPFSRLISGRPLIICIIIYYILLVIIIFLQEKNKKVWIASLLLPLLCFVRGGTSELEISMLDVGQGECIYIRGPKGNHYLIDGGSTDIKEVGRYRIEPFLKSEGVSRIDYVFLSHGDGDHVNGIIEVMERKDRGVEIGTIVLCDRNYHDEFFLHIVKLAKEQGIEVLEMKAEDMLMEGELKIECLGPNEEYSGEIGNDSSLILGIEYEEFGMLCTGDIESKGETALINTLEEEPRSFDVLKVSHHGSQTSSTEELLKLVESRIAIISAGIDNSYGHPHEEVISRLETYGNYVYQTNENGRIQIRYDEGKIEINKFF